MNNKYSFHIYDSEVFSVTVVKRISIIKKMLPLLLSLRKSRVLGAVVQELWTKNTYIFLTNHSIAAPDSHCGPFAFS